MRCLLGGKRNKSESGGKPKKENGQRKNFWPHGEGLPQGPIHAAGRKQYPKRPLTRGGHKLVQLVGQLINARYAGLESATQIEGERGGREETGQKTSGTKAAKGDRAHSG